MEGAPGQVHSLAQTSDGYLWLGTATGLYRFDGIEFQPFKPESRQSFAQRNIASLFATPDGGLWVGYWYGGVSYIKGGKVIDYGRTEGLPSSPVLSFARDRQGSIWIAAGKDGLARLEGSRWKKIGSDWNFSEVANTVFVSRTGTIWVGTPTSVDYLPEGERQFRTASRGLLRVKNFAESSDGILWMAETGYGVRPVPVSGTSNENLKRAVLVGSQAIAFDSQGSLWVTSLGNGIRRVPFPERLPIPKFIGPSAWRFQTPEVEEYTPENGLTSDYVNCVLQDREGNVWIGTNGGLDRFRQSPMMSVSIKPLSIPGEPPIPSRQSFTTSAVSAGAYGTLWAAGIGPQVLVKLQNQKVNIQLRDRFIDCLYRDPTGIIWVATPWSIFRLGDEHASTNARQSADPYRYSASMPVERGIVLRRLNLPKGGDIGVGLQSRVKAMTRDQEGRLWISMDSGTFRLESSGWRSLESFGGPHGAATSEFTDSQGRIWFGFGNAVSIVDGDSVRNYTGRDGISVGVLTTIQEKQSKIWIGGESGLEYLDGNRFQVVHSSEGNVFAGVSGIIADPGDGLWFSENRGVIHIHENQIAQPHSTHVEFESYSLLDGITAELRGSLAAPSTAQTTDGRIWFATTNGVTWIDPKRIPRNTVPPTVMIEFLSANATKYSAKELLKLPARTRDLQITYTATSLTIPERVRFRYKLEGQDKDWQEAGTRREAFYTNLDPGTYQFHVIACNNDGVWNETGATLLFTVFPAFEQTLWFKVLCATALAGCLWLLYFLRLRQVTANVQERLGARLEERTRIARELHDTLLQGFQGLVLRFDAVKKAIPGDHPAHKLMENVLMRADGVLLEGRERVRNLRQDEISASELPNRLAACGEELRQSRPIPFSISIVGTPKALDPTVGDEVYSIVQEAVTNAFLHSKSSKIEVEIVFDHQRLRLVVRDDGVGIKQAVVLHGRDGHWGIVGMRERAQKIGAQLKLWSQEGAGTEVELSIPVAIAYPFGSKQRHWLWFRRLWR